MARKRTHVTPKKGKSKKLGLILAIVVGLIVIGSIVGTPKRDGASALDTEAASPPYTIAETEDISYLGAKRMVLRVQVESELTSDQIKAICRDAAERDSGLSSCDEVTFFFYLPGSNTQTQYTAGMAEWNPKANGGQGTITIKAGNALGNNRLEKIASHIPEEKRHRIYSEVLMEEAKLGDGQEARNVIMSRYGVSKDDLIDILAEGTYYGWE